MDATTIAAAGALVLSIIVALSNILSLRNQIKQAKQPMVDDHEMLMEHDRRLANDHERLNDLKKASDVQSKVLLQIANHMIDNSASGDDKLVEARDELQNYLINR